PAREFGSGGSTHLLDQQVAHPPGDAGDANPDCHVLPPLGGNRIASRFYPLPPSKNSFTLEKKPSLSGLPLPWPCASASNSSSSSRWRRVRCCGVSTDTWMYISPRTALRSTEKPLLRSRN